MNENCFLYTHGLYHNNQYVKFTHVSWTLSEVVVKLRISMLYMRLSEHAVLEHRRPNSV